MRALLLISALCLRLNSYGQVSDSIDSAEVKKSSLGAWLASTDGNIEGGVILGPPPFTVGESNDLFLRGKGNWSFSTLRVPLKVMFDVGNDVAERGQRNRFSVQVDHQRLLRGVTKDSLNKLNVVNAALDSLNDVRAAFYRKSVSGRGQFPLSVGTDIPNSSLTIPDLGLDTSSLNVDSIGVFNPLDTLDTPSFGQLPVSIDTAIVPQTTEAFMTANSARDSMRVIEQRMDDLKLEQARLSALVQAGTKNKLLTKISDGLRRFQVGSCSAAPSEFLINGISHTGISLEVATSDLYMTFDHGRSYDDAWRNASMETDRLRQLQRTFFFADDEDLNPRRLTSGRLGLGLPESTHVHIGYLYGKREDAALGDPGASGSDISEINHVLEFDGAIDLVKGHGLRVVVARSLSRGSQTTEDQSGFNDLFGRREQQNQALMIAWRSKFTKTRTEVDLAYRSIDPLFHSMGMAFIRNGVKSLEAGLAQRLGKKLRVRVNGKAEERTPISVAGRTRILRGRFQAAFRPLDWCSLRASYVPLIASVEQAEVPVSVQRSNSIQLGTELTKRVRHNRIIVTADASRFGWIASDTLGAAGEAWNVSSGGSLQLRDRVEVGVLFNIFSGDFGSDVSTTSLRASWRALKGSEVSASIVFNSVQPGPAWNCSGTYLFLGKWYARASIASFDPIPNHYSQSFGDTDVDNYTCHAAIGFRW